LLEATASAGGREVARATAWRVLRTDAGPVASRLPAPAAPPDVPAVPLPDGWVDGYLSAIEWRMIRGGFTAAGPAAMWGRMRYPLVPDEVPGPLERVLAVADSGNGASWEMDFFRWYSINPELTVHLHREAEGEWICLDAQTTISPGGTGLATSVLSDVRGPVGVGAQSLLVAHRPQAQRAAGETNPGLAAGRRRERPAAQPLTSYQFLLLFSTSYQFRSLR
jgi:hypothetical protein